MVEHDPDSPRCMCEECEEERTNNLVQKESVTLADLYRRGRQSGLLRPAKAYN